MLCSDSLFMTFRSENISSCGGGPRFSYGSRASCVNIQAVPSLRAEAEG